MKLQFLNQKTEQSITGKYSRVINRPLIVIFIFILIIVVSIISTSSKEVIDYIKLQGFQGPYFKSQTTSYLESIPKETFKSLVSSSDIKDMRIDIKFMDWEKLTRFRNIAMENGIISKNEKEYVNASILYDGKRRDVKLRLKGDWTDHLLGEKWSFRVKVKKKKYIDGLRVMSLQNPQARDYQGLVIINEMLREYNIIVPRDSFVNVIVNGNDIGIMALTEHFNKELLESSGRKEGVIIKFDESSLWESRLDKKLHDQNEYRAKIVPFQSKKLKKNKKLSKDFEIAAGLLRGFLNEKLTAHDVFDVKLMGEFLAIHDLWGDSHGLIWHNLRFYYNPLTAKLEPIAFDELLYHANKGVSSSGFAKRLKNNKYISLVYVNTLKKLQQKIKNTEYLAKYIELDNKYETLLRSEFWLKPPPLMKNKKLSERIDLILDRYSDSIVHKTPESNNIGWAVNTKETSDIVNLYSENNEDRTNVIKANQYVSEFYRYGLSNLGLKNAYHGYNMHESQDIVDSNRMKVSKSNLIPIESADLDKFHKLVNVYLVDKENPRIEVQNYTPYTLTIKGVSITHSKNNKIIRTNIEINGQNGIVHPLSKGTEKLVKTINLGDIDEFKNIKKVDVIVTLLGHDASRTIKAERYSKVLSSKPIPESSVEHELDKHDFLTFDEKNNIIKIKKGVWDVKHPIIIPPGYTLVADKGVSLFFDQQSYILAHGQIMLLGSKEFPIILTSKNPNQYWKGVVIIGNSELPISILNNVSINNITSLDEENWSINAGFFVHQVNLIMNDVAFHNNNSEDALNIVNSKYDIKNISIKNAVSDGLDSDFSDGRIVGGTFSNIGYGGGGDALDFSGSKATVTNLIITKVNDKGLSVGENSIVNAKNLQISDLSVAIAVKDGSILNIDESEINNAYLAAIMAYTKKNAYGGATAYINNVKIYDTDVDVKSDLGSNVFIDNIAVTRENLDIKKLYKTIMKPGLR